MPIATSITTLRGTMTPISEGLLSEILLDRVSIGMLTQRIIRSGQVVIPLVRRSPMRYRRLKLRFVLLCWCLFLLIGCQGDSGVEMPVADEMPVNEIEPKPTQLLGFSRFSLFQHLALGFKDPVLKVGVALETESQGVSPTIDAIPASMPPVKQWKVHREDLRVAASYLRLWPYDRGVLTPHPLNLIVFYEDTVGIHQKIIRTQTDDVNVHRDPLQITSAPVFHGAKNVPVEPLNRDGIRIDFTHAVIGQISISPLGGAPLGWVSKVEGQTAWLIPQAGEALVSGTVYVITIDVETGAGAILEENCNQIIFMTE